MEKFEQIKQEVKKQYLTDHHTFEGLKNLDDAIYPRSYQVDYLAGRLSAYSHLMILINKIETDEKIKQLKGEL